MVVVAVAVRVLGANMAHLAHLAPFGQAGSTPAQPLTCDHLPEVALALLMPTCNVVGAGACQVRLLPGLTSSASQLAPQHVGWDIMRPLSANRKAGGPRSAQPSPAQHWEPPSLALRATHPA